MNFKDLQDISLDEIYELQERGLSSETIPKEFLDYYDAMDKVRSMSNRFDVWGSRDNILDYLINVEGLTRHMATKLFSQAREFFYIDRQESKEALLNWAKDMMEKNIQVAVLLQKDTSDGAKINKMIREYVDVVEKLYPEGDGLDEDFVLKPIKLYTMKPEDVGLPSVSRKEIKAIVSKYPELPEVVKRKILQEAMAIPMEVFISESQDPREQ